jgi:glycosyltransferase involved in cell wall biosynthesis
MARKRVLYVLHNHPTLFPGGAEQYAIELFDTLRGSEEIEPLLIARIGRTSVPQGNRPGTPFSTVDGEPDQYFLFTESEPTYDYFFGTSNDKSLYTTYFADFLETYRPDVVHFQHTLHMGYDLVSTVRRVLPQAPILYTLHEYLPICHRQGQLLRTEEKNEELCLKASPRRCNECFPHIPSQDFFLREQFIKAHLAHVDLFIAPSQFLLQRYVDWGVPPERIVCEDYGRIPAVRLAEPEGDRPRNRFGYFGQFNPYKGVETLLEAMATFADRPDIHMRLNGANLDQQAPEFQESFAELLERAKENVTLIGPYHPSDVPLLMRDIDWVVVSSRWWENSPLVIQEAFMQRRPVICSGIGGMAEKVTHDVNGLHFNVGDPDSMAAAISRAATEPGLWDRLRDGIPDVLTVDDHIENLTRMYDELLERRSAPAAAPVAPSTV